MAPLGAGLPLRTPGCHRRLWLARRDTRRALRRHPASAAMAARPRVTTAAEAARVLVVVMDVEQSGEAPSERISARLRAAGTAVSAAFVDDVIDAYVDLRHRDPSLSGLDRRPVLVRRLRASSEEFVRQVAAGATARGCSVDAAGVETALRTLVELTGDFAPPVDPTERFTAASRVAMAAGWPVGTADVVFQEIERQAFAGPPPG